MKIHLLTLFPEMLEQIFSHSILKRACDQRLVQVICHQIRDYADNKHKSVDDYPYGGGCGMVMTPQPIFDAHAAVMEQLQSASPVRTVYCTPKGRRFTQGTAEELAQEQSLIILCGHYEGVDQRVIDELVTDEISIGDYVLTGGELPAAVMVDAIARMLPGVLKENRSYQEESLYGGLLEYPHYTRPPVFRNLAVPKVLLSGHHEKIRQWRQYHALRETWLKRPDLIDEARLTEKQSKWLLALKKNEKVEL